MRRIQIRELVDLTASTLHVFHDSGELLCSHSNGFTRRDVECFAEAGIEQVTLLDPYDNVVQFALAQKNKFILTDELQGDHVLVGPITDSTGELLLRHGEPVRAETRALLKKHGFYSVCVKKRPSELHLEQVKAFRRQWSTQRRRAQSVRRPRLDAVAG